MGKQSFVGLTIWSFQILLKNVVRNINDIMSAITRGRIDTAFAHKASYWTDITAPAEILANISAIDLLELDGKGEFEGFLNLIYDAYISMVEG